MQLSSHDLALQVGQQCKEDAIDVFDNQFDPKTVFTNEREGRCAVVVIEMQYFNLDQEIVFQGMQAKIPWPGTAHTSAWLAVPTALRVWEALGLEEARQHNHRKLLTAVHILKEEWGDHIVILGSYSPSQKKQFKIILLFLTACTFSPFFCSSSPVAFGTTHLLGALRA